MWVRRRYIFGVFAPVGIQQREIFNLQFLRLAYLPSDNQVSFRCLRCQSECSKEKKWQPLYGGTNLVLPMMATTFQF